MRSGSIFFLFTFLLSEFCFYGQNTQVLKNIGVSSDAYVHTWRRTSDGGAVALHYKGDTAMDNNNCPILANNYAGWSHLTRFDSLGNVVWQHRGSAWNAMYTADVAPNGDVLVVGGVGQQYVHRYGSNGILKYKLPINDGTYMLIRCDYAGNYYLYANINYTFEYNGFSLTNTNTNNTASHFLIKVGPDDKVIWYKEPSIPLGYRPNFVIDHNNEIILEGEQAILKLDPDGNTLWSESISGDVHSELRCDAFNNLYSLYLFCGTFSLGTLQFTESTPPNIDCGDWLVVKRLPNGKIDWITRISGGSSREGVGGFDVSPHGYCFFAGALNGTYRVGNDSLVLPNLFGGAQYFARLDLQGKLTWYTTAQGAYPSYICALENESVFFTGSFDKFKIDGDSISSCGGWNYFLLKKEFQSVLTGLVDAQKPSSWRVGPIPATSFLNCTYDPNDPPERYRIIDLTGQEITVGTVYADPIYFTLKAGLYIIQLSNERVVQSYRIAITD
jgi:hypothetical protein